ncbi:Pentatricopeptide repeat-containing protein [Arachis hypogaea]|uniref:Pentatricopeptide repeat-containing protein n=1 Tax=Arachis hypogaea TaxID=3818 RepID=A0A445AR74_ARAHY|nr:Pentatricopeptide repeat-containing protein [Arachis hypogaea]RYR28901.1 hypothetical protein Ahy_B01g053119 [Arachis hypogaea]
MSSKLTKVVLSNTNNPKLAWHLLKRILSSSTSSSLPTHDLLRSTRAAIRVLIAANMHHQIDDLCQFILATQPPNIAHPSLLFLVRALAHSSSHLPHAFSRFKSLRAHFPLSSSSTLPLQPPPPCLLQPTPL